MGFDPDAYLKTKEQKVAKAPMRESGTLMDAAPDSGGFDPDAYLAQKPEPTWRDTKLPWGTAGGTVQGIADALPMAGMVAGGVVGTPANVLTGGLPGGTIAGAGLGAGAGEALKGMIESGVLGKERTREEVWGEPPRAIIDGMGAEAGGAAIGGMIRGAVGSGGKAIYKSGLKKIDQEVAKYGKEPVSDLLMKNDIAGNSKQIFDKMQSLGDKLLAERNDILGQATKAGAEVDVKAALKDAQALVDNMKGVDNPEMKKAVQMLQGRIDKYMSRAAKPAQAAKPEIRATSLTPQLKELPVSVNQAPLDPKTRMIREQQFTPRPELTEYMAPTLSNPATGELDNFSGKDLMRRAADPRGPEYARFKKVLSEPVIRDSVDEIVSLPRAGQYSEKVYRPAPYEVAQEFPEILLSEATPKSAAVKGPTPIQASAWKTSSASNVGKKGWQELAMSPEGKKFDKALSGGLRGATEKSVAQSLGPEYAAELANKNKELGQILSSRERALLDAQQAANKNAVSSVDGMLMGAGNPLMLALKKTADLAKMTGPRTLVGRQMSTSAEQGLVKAIEQSPELQGALIRALLNRRRKNAKDAPMSYEGDIEDLAGDE